MPFGGRENALTYIPQLIEEQLSNTQIVRFLREQGFGYRNQNMFEDVNRVRLENFGASFVPTLDRDSIIPDRFMRTWEGSVDYDYRAVVKYEYLDPDTGTVKTTGTTIYFDTPPSQAEVTEMFEVRRQTIEELYSHVDLVYGAIKVHYFKNVLPRGDRGE